MTINDSGHKFSFKQQHVCDERLASYHSPAIVLRVDYRVFCSPLDFIRRL